MGKYEDKIAKEIAKAQKKFGDAFDEAQFRQTNPRVLENQKKYDDLHHRYHDAMQGPDLEALKQIILDEEIVCPISGTKNWTDVRQFNLMFSTEMGASAEGSMKVYLRPETAQGIFVNYLNVQKTGRMKIPFGIAQIGKAFRNEIVARQFIFRMREVEQMEMQFFIKPGTELDWFAKWKETRMKWHQNLGFGAENYRFHDHDMLAHYANAATDIEFHMPFGICQIGKAFRNEVVARQFVFRMREFEQMELQFFCQPGTEMKWFEFWKTVRLAWHEALGMGNENYRYHDHEKLAHYANAATDIEFKMPFGFKEVEGIHSRTNFDLSQHEKYSGRSIKYFDPEKNESYVPYDVETSIGVVRMFLSVMCHSYCEEKLENGETRVDLRLPEAMAPIKCAVFPLDKKYGLPELAHEIVDELKFHFNTHYGDPKDSIGKRYRRQDAIGTPFCITVDHETPNDHKVTLRYRDTMEQERVAISDLRSIIEERVSITSVLKKLGKEIKNF